jgi:hypothetical protein
VWRSKVTAPRFVTLTVDVGEWSDSRSDRFAAGKELPVQNDDDDDGGDEEEAAWWFSESVWVW